MEKDFDPSTERAALAPEDTQVHPGKKWPQYVAAISATLSAAVGGTCLAWTSPALPMLPFNNQQGSWVGSLLSLGAIPGAAMAGTLTHAIGPKPAIAALAVPFLISYIIIASVQDLWAIYAARIIAGLALGGVVVAVPIYVAEIAEDSVRGTLGSILQVMFNVGILFANAVGAAKNYAALAWSSAALAVAALGLILLMPESPRCLLARGKLDEAQLSLQWLRGTPQVTQELANMTEVVEREREEQRASSFRELVSMPAMKRALIISIGLVVIQQLSGINVVFLYTQRIFKDAGSSMTPSTCSIVVAVVMLLFSQIAAPLSDKAGRRILLLTSAIAMSISLASLGGYFQAKESPPSEGNDHLASLTWLPLTTVIAYLCAYLLGFGPLPWAVMAEVLPPTAKGPAGAIVASACWILSFIATKCFQDLVEALGTAAAFFLFAGFSFLGAVFVFFLLPETKGKSLEQIQSQLALGFRVRSSS
ncbi:facilitated trehalose transporter Tret1-2 homolog [Hetaerina americana]|uniref:facilitated trehalose transporter Tret1-2 homolog n=1 Tax=Hetaerina americana TaxID=62018 RepID=UPI003A7F4FB7